MTRIGKIWKNWLRRFQKVEEKLAEKDYIMETGGISESTEIAKILNVSSVLEKIILSAIG